MKNVNRKSNTAVHTRIIAVLAAATTVLAIGAGAAVIKISDMNREAREQAEAAQNMIQVRQMEYNEAENAPAVVNCNLETPAQEPENELMTEARKWFSEAELEFIAEADLPQMINQRKEVYGRYLNEEEMKLSHSEKVFLYKVRMQQEDEAAREQAAREQVTPEMKLDIVDMTMKIGEQVTLNATLNTADDATTYTWKMDDSNIATVNPNGKTAVITAKSAGTTVVTVYSGETKALCIVRVKAPATFTMDVTAKTVQEGDHFAANASSEIASAKSTDTNVADVKFNGTKLNVHTYKAGTAVINITGKNGKSAQIIVTVKAYELTLNNTAMTLEAGATAELSATKGTVYTWHIDNTDVIRIHNSGNTVRIEALGAGTATVTATSLSGTTAKCTVTVKAAKNELKISDEELTVQAGYMADLFIVSGNVALYNVSDEEIIHVEFAEDGKSIQILALAAGTAELKLYDTDGNAIICTVTVEGEAYATVMAEGFEQLCDGAEGIADNSEIVKNTNMTFDTNGQAGSSDMEGQQ